MLKSIAVSAAQEIGRFFLRLLILFGAYFLIEVLAVLLLAPEDHIALWFGALWAGILSALVLLMPRTAGRIAFGMTFCFFVVWMLAQTGYYCVFGRMMWLSDIFYAGEGADFLTDVLGAFPVMWWIGGAVLLALGAVILWKFPANPVTMFLRIPYAAVVVLCMLGLSLLPETIFLRDLDIWGTRSEFGQSSSYRATYNTMYDAKKTYDICGLMHLTFRDVWEHELYPLTPAYQKELQEQTGQIDAYFEKRGDHADNEMTGIFAGKNVVLVLMESMDDWMITKEDTPTLVQLMNEGINFTNFYTPGYGTARTLNSEFCVNTGIYLPTNAGYVFDYVTNGFNQSIASQMVDNGYTAEVFHYNTPTFYSRGVFEPAMGYNRYNTYEDYVTDKKQLYDECLLFEIPELDSLFFREGQTFNTVITRSAHLSYAYNEVLSHYALKQYPEYRGKYDSQEEDCARVKAKLVDDFFARLLQELSENGQLENTVIIGVTDHYTYGYKNTEELYAHSQVDDTLLLEKTPCFIWSAEGPGMSVDKTLHTADFLPTVLNLMGIQSPYQYLGQDAFDPDYEGYALFPDGSWISDGVACKAGVGGNDRILFNVSGKELTQEYMDSMSEKVGSFIHISNLLLTSDYYRD